VPPSDTLRSATAYVVIVLVRFAAFIVCSLVNVQILVLKLESPLYTAGMVCVRYHERRCDNHYLFIAIQCLCAATRNCRAAILERYCANKQLVYTRLRKKAGISRSSLLNWRVGKSMVLRLGAVTTFPSVLPIPSCLAATPKPVATTVT
jgi:hypothetical protein